MRIRTWELILAVAVLFAIIIVQEQFGQQRGPNNELSARLRPLGAAQPFPLASWIKSINMNAEPMYGGKHYVIVDIDLTVGPYPSQINLYSDGRLVYQQNVNQTPRGQSQTVVWAPDGSEAGLQRTMRVDLITPSGTFSDSKNVSVW